ncbi:MAG: HD domain-containing protein [Eubacterium sp.]|nr:HD domain-containing protein [Eubacterium sp.]
MFDFIVDHQLNIILAMCGACGVCALFVFLSKSLTGARRRHLLLIEVSATGLLLFDRGATIFDGQPGEVAYWMVRICNLSVFLLTLLIVFFFNRYLMDVFEDTVVLPSAPATMKVTSVLCLVGMVLVLVAHFTGLFYTFDANNTYERSTGFILSYIFPFLVPVLQLLFIFQYFKKLRRGMRFSLLLFPLVPMVASLLQLVLYGLMLTDMALALMGVQLYVVALMDVSAALDRTRKKEMAILLREEKNIFRLFKQIVTAFVSAIDAKDSYTRGHATRSAKYAGRLAELAGKDGEECEAAYFSALLHDVGKIALPDSLLKKRGHLSEEESKMFDEHVLRGQEILSRITEFPYLQDAAHYHHEWYDGTGFPEGLAGEEIPELVRIVTLADVYDSMSSVRENRDPLPQQTIREEIIKGTGKQFDPEYAKVMLAMIDADKDFQLREHSESETDEPDREIVCGPYRSRYSRGIPVTSEVVRVTFRYESSGLIEGEFSAPSILLYDSLDGRVHTDERSIDINRYTEFGEVWFDGHMICTRARNMKMEKEEVVVDDDSEYLIEAVKVGDHIRLRLTGDNLYSEVLVALPDSSGTAFVSLTGEHCHISEIEADETGIELREGDIPRIADEVTYIDRMVGDVPNVQVDSYFSAVTKGVEVTDGLEIAFHTMTLPSANLVWNCPFLVLYKSDDHRVHGKNYNELVIVRLDGESVETGGSARSITETRKEEDFENWDKWKAINKKGYECRVYFRRKRNRIILQTENAGIFVRSTIYMKDSAEDVRVALTGDMCALTDIRFVSA